MWPSASVNKTSCLRPSSKLISESLLENRTRVHNPSVHRDTWSSVTFTGAHFTVKYRQEAAAGRAKLLIYTPLSGRGGFAWQKWHVYQRIVSVIVSSHRLPSASSGSVAQVARTLFPVNQTESKSHRSVQSAATRENVALFDKKTLEMKQDSRLAGAGHEARMKKCESREEEWVLNRPLQRSGLCKLLLTLSLKPTDRFIITSEAEPVLWPSADFTLRPVPVLCQWLGPQRAPTCADKAEFANRHHKIK